MPPEQQIDEDLMKSLLIAKKKPRNFALISKGAATLHLMLSKKPIKDPDVLAAKKMVGGNAATIGVVSLDPEVDKGLVYRVTELPAVSEKKVKQFIKEKTDLNLNARFELVAALVPIDESDDDAAPDNGVQADVNAGQPAPQADSTLQGESADASTQVPEPPVFDPMFPLKEAMKRLSPKIAEFVKENPNLKGSIFELVANFQSQVKGLDEKGARQSLLDIGAKLREVSSQVKPTGNVGLSDLNPLASKIKEALQHEKYGEEVKKLVTQFKESVGNQDFDVAGNLLDSLEKLLAEYEKHLQEEELKKKEYENVLSKIPTSLAKSIDQSILEKLLPTLANPTLGKRFGAGAFGVTYALTSQDGNPLVGKFSINESKDKLLQEEMNNYEVLANCPGIPRCLGIQEVSIQVEIPKRTKIKRKTLLLEAIQGQEVGVVFSTLKKKVALDEKNVKEGEISQAEFWEVTSLLAAEILKTLKEFSENKMVHCDLKEQNIMIDAKTGKVKVIDIGGAVKHGFEGNIQSTPGYCPTGQGESDNLDNLWDVHCLGMTLKKLLQGIKFPMNEAFSQLVSKMTQPKATRSSVELLLSESVLTLDENQRKRAMSRFMTNTVEPNLEHKEEALLQVYPGYSKEAWDYTMENALEMGIVSEDKREKIKAASEMLRKFESAKSALEKYSIFTEMEKIKKKLEDISGFDSNQVRVEFTAVRSGESLQVRRYVELWENMPPWISQTIDRSEYIENFEFDDPDEEFKDFWQEGILNFSEEILNAAYEEVISDAETHRDEIDKDYNEKRSDLERNKSEASKRRQELLDKESLTEEEISDLAKIDTQLLDAEVRLNTLDARNRIHKEVTDDLLLVGAIRSSSFENMRMDLLIDSLTGKQSELYDKSSVAAEKGASDGEIFAGGGDEPGFNAKKFREILALAHEGPLKFFGMTEEEHRIPAEFDECDDPIQKEELLRVFSASLEVAAKRIHDNFAFFSDHFSAYSGLSNEYRSLLDAPLRMSLLTQKMREAIG